MIISHSKKVIFYRTPKTGSETATLIFRLAGLVDKNSSRDFCTPAAESALKGLNWPRKLSAEFEHYTQMRRVIQAKGSKLRRQKSEDPDGNDKIDLSEDETKFMRQSKEETTYPFTRPVIIHSTADTLIKEGLAHHNLATEEEVYGYDSYAYIRNPLSKFVSAYTFQQKVYYEAAAKKGHRLPPFDYLFHLDDFHDVVKNLKEHYYKSDPSYGVVIYRPQIDWFKINGETHKDGKRLVQPLVFENMVEEGNKMLGKHGCFDKFQEWPRINTQAQQGPKIGFSEKPSVEAWVNPYPEIRKILMDFYKEDVKLWEETTGEKV